MPLNYKPNCRGVPGREFPWVSDRRTWRLLPAQVTVWVVLPAKLLFIYYVHLSAFSRTPSSDPIPRSCSDATIEATYRVAQSLNQSITLVPQCQMSKKNRREAASRQLLVTLESTVTCIEVRQAPVKLSLRFLVRHT